VTSPETTPEPRLTRDGETRRRVELSISAEQVEEATAAAARDMGRNLRLPGFRKGHVPASVVRQRFATELEDEIVQKLASRHMAEFLDGSEEEPVAPPVLEKHEVVEDGTLELVALFEVQPPIKLDSYRELKGRRPSTVVSEEDVDLALQSLVKGMTRLRAVEDRGAQDGDDVVVEMKGQHLTGDDKGSTFQQEEIALQMSGDDVHPDLLKALLGAQVGFTRDVTIEYPEDYRTPALAGRTIRYDLSVKAVREPQVPELNDDLAREAGDFKDLDELRQRVRDDLGRRKEHESQEAVRQSVLGELLERHAFEVPAVLIEQEVRHRLEALARQLASQGVDPSQAGVDWPAEKERIAGKARDDIRAARLLDAIAEAEEILVDEEEVTRRLEHEAEHAKRPLAALRASWEKEGRLDALKRHLKREAVLDFLISVGHIDEEGESA
jgi:trigger factor